MNLTLTVLEITAPVFLLALVGYVWVKLGFEYRLEFVTRLAMTLAVPCLVFTALMKTEMSGSALSALFFASLAVYGLIIAVFALGLRVFDFDMRTYLAPLSFGNTGNLGLPLALFAFGPEGLSYAVIIFAVMAVLSFTFGIWVVSGGGSLLTALKEPLVGATLLGAVFMWQEWQTPVFLTNTLELIGQLAIPLMLITLGVAIARLTPGKIGRAVVFSVAKVIICVASAVAVGLWFALPDVALFVLVMQVTTPVAVTSYLLAAKYGADADAVAGLVFVSTFLSVLALPGLLAFML